VTKEQIERARQIHVLDYVLSYEPDLYKRVGNGYRMKEHPSLAVNEKGFYRHSQNGEVKGITALDYLTDVRGYHFVDAVCLLISENPYFQPLAKHITPMLSVTPNATPPPERIPFDLPLRNGDNKRVIAYLQSRGIDRDLIMDCVERGVLYESKYYHNAVFLGKDEHGKPRFAAMRSTTTRFMRNADGSDIRYGFVLPPNNPNTTSIAACESPIDCLSHMTLCKQGYIPQFDGWRLSLGGTSDLALKHFLERHSEVTHCVICTDNDAAGDMIAAKIADMSGITTKRSPPITGKDYNDMLQAVKKAERIQNRAHTRAHGERG